MRKAKIRLTKRLVALILVMTSLVISASAAYTNIPESAKNKTYDNVSTGKEVQPSPKTITPYSPSFPNMYVTLYKSVTPFSEHIKNLLEPNSGAYYYAQAAHTSTYNMASTWVDFPIDLIRGTRNAYICLSFTSDGSKWNKFDIGLQNAGNDWQMYGWGGHNKNSSNSDDLNMKFSPSTIPKGATKVNFSLKVQYEKGKDIAIATFDFYQGTKFLQTSIGRFEQPAGTMFLLEYGSPKVSFSRLVSLVPSDKRDERDWSKLNVTMYNLRLYETNGTPVAWDWSRIMHSWALQCRPGYNPPTTNGYNNIPVLRIAQNSGGYISDTINIYHFYPIHKE